MESGNDMDEHEGVLRLRVPVGRGHVEAFISLATCLAAGACHGGTLSLSEYCRVHRPLLERIVADKVRAGARHPIVVRAHDLWRHGADGS